MSGNLSFQEVVLHKSSLSHYNTLLKSNKGKPALSFPDSFNRTLEVLQLKQPELLNRQKYAKIYHKLLKDTANIHMRTTIDASYKQKQKIRKSIEKSLQKITEELSFQEAFKIQRKIRSKSFFIEKTHTKSQIGHSRMEKQKQFQNTFFQNRKKTLDFSQECLLTEFFLKDKQLKRKTPDLFLQLKQNVKHMRMNENPQINEKAFLKHSIQNYNDMQACFNYKNKFIQNCLQKSKMHTSTRRKYNFKVIEYTLDELKKGLISQYKYQKKLPEEQLKQNNKIYKLLIQYRFINFFKGFQYDFEQSMQRFKKDLYQLQPQFIFRQKQVQDKIQAILTYKKVKTFCFQDFKELLCFIGDLYKKDVISLFQDKFPNYFQKKQEKIILQNLVQVNKYLKTNKIKLLLEIMFNTFPQKHIMQQFLPIKLIPSIFKYYKISQRDYNMTKLFTNYSWVQRHEQGLTSEQFVKGSILFGMKKDDWKGIQEFLRPINLKNYI